MKLRNVLLAATILAAPVAVKAQPVSGLYVGAGAGYNYLQETKIKNLQIGPTVGTAGNTKIRDDGGFVVVGSVGYGFGNGLRVELEGNYRDTHIRFKGGNGSPGTGGGNLLSYGPMVNVLYDLPVAFPVTPYVGVGVGYGLVEPQNVSTNGALGGPAIRFKDDSKGGLAAQGILGVAYNIPPVPGLALTAEYRFYANVENEKFKGSTVATPGSPSVGVSARTDNQFNHAILLGVRYAFNAAPPPPPPAPIVAAPVAGASRTYLVFFDWDRADLTARARQIIAEAAQNSTRVQSTRLEVNGYTDLSGTAQYNQGLSVRRAESVAAELVKDGVPRSAITIQGFGETHPLVQTAKGVREPQNRRVEIILH